MSNTMKLSEVKELLNAEVYTGADRLDTEVCEACGFESPSYFASIFRRTFGMSPEEYRKAMP